MALASALSNIANDNSPKAGRNPRVRFSQIVSLSGGENEGAAAQTDLAYEEHAFFGFARGEEFSCPASWLGQLIERAGRKATMRGLRGRPIAVCAPSAALAHPDAPMAAEACAARANLCPQEFRLEFADCALVDEEYSALDNLYGFYHRGFRIGIDARTSWASPFDTDARMLIEAVRLDARMVDEVRFDEDRLDAALGAGVMLYAENMQWRDAEKMLSMGITHALDPRPDC